MNGLAQALALMLLAGLLSFGASFVWPLRPPAENPWRIEARAALDAVEPVLWIDARTAEEYRAGHWPGAIPLNEDTWDELIEPALERWEPGMQVVVYCSDAGCKRSEEVARRLREEVGIEEVRWLAGGWETLREMAR